ncbi:MAG: hypothetical protein LBT98_04090 [Puniceicoccales bacterium]|jgi:hypothetical protein|nr:hypothetical protein [Puniceicoccales bacterium]
MAETPWEDRELDPLQRLKLFLENFADTMPEEKWLNNPQDNWHYVLARVVSQVIGEGKMEEWLTGKAGEAMAMAPAEFDARMEELEREHNIVIVDEIDRWINRAKDFLSQHSAKEGAAEDIVKEMLARHGPGNGPDGQGGEGDVEEEGEEEEDEEGDEESDDDGGEDSGPLVPPAPKKHADSAGGEDGDDGGDEDGDDSEDGDGDEDEDDGEGWWGRDGDDDDDGDGDGNEGEDEDEDGDGDGDEDGHGDADGDD